MKVKLFAAVIIILALAGTWLGADAWRAHKKLVTLRVRNAPLAEVIQRIESQVHETIRFDQKLDARITLDVKNRPLAEVLDLVSEQAGARWGKTYAVYSSERSLRGLESVLQGRTELDTAGWTNVAPRFDSSTLAAPTEFGSAGPGQIIINSKGAADGKGPMLVDEDVKRDGATVTTNEDGTARTVTRIRRTPEGGKIIKVGPGGTVVENNDTDAGPAHKSGILTVRRMVGPGGTTTTMMDGDGRVKVTRTSADGTVLKEDQWSSERLIMETGLFPKLGEDIPSKATTETAAQAAKKVHGKYALYYALDKSPIPNAGAMGGLVRSAMRRLDHKGGSNDMLLNGDIQGRVEAEAKQHRLEQLSKSPEQQVQEARQKQAAQSSP
jgi:hypothetical protein